jgi:acyl carrier protein
MDPKPAFGLMADLLEESSSRISIVALEWAQMSAAMRGMAPPGFLSELIEMAPSGGTGDAEAAEARRRELSQLPPDALKEQLLDFVKDLIANVLGVPPAQLLPEVDVREAGFDSLMALELRYKIESGLAIAVPVAGLMEDLSPGRVAELVAEIVLAADSGEGPAHEDTVVVGEI